MTVLALRDLHIDFRGGAGLFAQLSGARPRVVRALDGVDLAIDEGETLALVGESGSGKTTLGRTVNLLVRPTSGRIEFEGHDVTALEGAKLRAHRRAVQMIFQNPYDALDPRLTVGVAIAEPLRLHGIGDRHERRAAADEMLSAVDLHPATFRDRYPADLSGGQLQRIAIARALVLSPRLIVADEPVSMLDVSVRAGVMNLMLDLQQSLGLSCLFITHDLAVARIMASRVAVMYLGRIVEEGPTDRVIAEPAHPYTRMLIDAVPDFARRDAPARTKLRTDDAGAASDSGCRFAMRCPLVRDICRSVAPPSISVADGHAASCHALAEPPAGRHPLGEGHLA
jgi:oligopeptide/dipeptide ABC transporter ATP-binding protein